MRAAGIREARQSLSVLLEDVRKGHEIVITDRGKPVARLVPPLPLSAKPFAGCGHLRRKMPVFVPPLSSRLVEDAQPRAVRARPAWEPRWSEVPGPVYLDASVLATLYFPEAGSDALDRALRGRRDLTVADLAVTELLAAFAGRRLAEGKARAKTAARPAPGRPRLRDLPPSGDRPRDPPSRRAAAPVRNSSASGRRCPAHSARHDRGRRLVPHLRPAPRRSRAQPRARRISMRPTEK